jgi:CRISPR-associated protein Csx17
MPEVVLKGCTPEPLMHYLKALGVLRLVAEDAEHGDPLARGRWRNDAFVLVSRLSEEALQNFLLHYYCPTPILAPWAGGSGFFSGDNIKFVDALANSATKRFEGYRDAISLVRTILREEGIREKPTGETKSRLLRMYRGRLPEQVIRWMDAAMALQDDAQSFAPLLGTGGNDGRLDFTQNFMARLGTLRLDRAEPVGDSSRWLRSALFAVPTAGLGDAAVGQFSPGRAGGPNATQGMEGAPTDNPWDFVLMLEGALVIAGAVVRRAGTAAGARGSFPFTVRSRDVGSTSTAAAESADSRGELWLPLWARSVSLRELELLFGEGRADTGSGAARDAVDFARAVATLGVDRGIQSFSRVRLLKRSGKAFLAVSSRRVQVIARPSADLIREVDPWLERLRRACSGDKVPARVSAALRSIDEAIFEFCTHGGRRHFQGILIALGVAERALATSVRFTKESRLEPLAGLSPAWVEAADLPDDSEFEIALALAGVHDPKHVIGSLRTNLESVTLHRNARRHAFAKWAERDRAVVWNAADLCANLTSVLERRVMDGARSGCADLPLSSPSAASPSSIIAFLHGQLDEQRIERLVWGLMLVDRGGMGSRRSSLQSRPVQGDAYPPLYALLKLLFLPVPIVPMGGGIGGGWRLATFGESGVRIRPEPAVLALLRSGRVGEAACIAMRRLRASGLSPIPHRRSGGPSRDDVWREVRLTPREGQRLSASLLIPLRTAAVSHLIRQAIRSDGTDAATNTITLNSIE